MMLFPGYKLDKDKKCCYVDRVSPDIRIKTGKNYIASYYLQSTLFCCLILDLSFLDLNTKSITTI